jgi:hypothetical protein
VAKVPTVHIVASNQHRNGKTLLARMLADYLLLDGHDPFLIDTDSPAGYLRNFFPGRTQLADFANVQGQIKIFDTMLESTGRDYIVDLTARHTDAFFASLQELNYVAELHKRGYRLFLFYIVDTDPLSLRRARELQEAVGADLFIPVRNAFIGSLWPTEDISMDLPELEQQTIQAILDRRFSIRAYVLGDRQNLSEQADRNLKAFVYEVLQSLNNLETTLTLQQLR